MTEDHVLGNSMYNHYAKLMRSLAAICFVVAALSSLFVWALGFRNAFGLFLLLVVVIPFILFPPYSPRTVTLSEDKMILDYQWPLKDVVIRWTDVSVIKAWRRRPLLIPEFCTLTFFEDNGIKIRPPLYLHVSRCVADEIEKLLRVGNRGVTIEREKPPWYMGRRGWGDD